MGVFKRVYSITVLSWVNEIFSELLFEAMLCKSDLMSFSLSVDFLLVKAIVARRRGFVKYIISTKKDKISTYKIWCCNFRYLCASKGTIY